MDKSNLVEEILLSLDMQHSGWCHCHIRIHTERRSRRHAQFSCFEGRYRTVAWDQRRVFVCPNVSPVGMTMEIRHMRIHDQFH